jgi:hypothetical protein
MTTRALLDELAQHASHAEPPALDDVTARRMIDRAVDHARDHARAARLGSRRQRFTVPSRAVAALAAACALVVGWFVLRSPATRSSVELTRVTLPSGDRLVGTANARFELAPSADRVQLHNGTLLVGARHRFQLATPHLVATATSTVFSVESDPTRSRVQVYRGAVDIEQAGTHHHIAAGTVWDSEVVVAATATARPTALVIAIDELLATAPIAAAVPTPPSTATAAATDSDTDSATDSDTDTDTATDTAAAIDTAATTDTASRATIVAGRGTTSRGDVAAGRDTTGRAEVVAGRDASRTATATRAEPAATLDELLVRARSHLAAGKFDDALAITKLAASRGATKGVWRIVTADALRGLKRYADAATAYERAASELSRTDAIEAGYTAAYLWFHDLDAPTTALKVLVTARVDEPGSPLEERGLALRVRLLDALGRRAEARPYAERYLAKFPNTQLRPLMQSISQPTAQPSATTP